MADTLYCILHIPKCAGRTIEAHLHKHLGPDAFWRPAKRTRNFPLELLRRKYDDRLPGKARAVQAISGHFIGASIERYFVGRRIKRVILLRRPADLLLSWYNFRMMRYIAAGKAPYSFRVHLRSMQSDPIAHFLLQRWLELPLWRIAMMGANLKVRLLDDLFESFDFIGDIHDCDRLVASISNDLQIESKAERMNTRENWLKRVDWQPLRYENLTHEHIAMISRMTALDDYLWRRWALKEPVSFDAKRAGRQFFAHELQRPYFELLRRYQRRWRSYNLSG